MAGLISVAFAKAGSAQTELLTFDDLPGSVGVIMNGYGGLQWQYFRYVNATQAYIVSGYHNGIVSPDTVALNSAGNPAQLTGGVFNLNSAYLTGAWNDGLQVEVQGFVGVTLSYDNTYTVSTAGPILINFDYVGVDEVNFISSGGTNHGFPGGNGTQFAMDNLSVTLVPEPCSLAIFTVSLAVLRFLAAKRRFAVISA